MLKIFPAKRKRIWVFYVVIIILTIDNMHIQQREEKKKKGNKIKHLFFETKIILTQLNFLSN